MVKHLKLRICCDIEQLDAAKKNSKRHNASKIKNYKKNIYQLKMKKAQEFSPQLCIIMTQFIICIL